MWNGTADILNAKPTKINTIAKTAPIFSLFNSFAIKSKFVDPEKPYNKEHQYNNKPDDNALKIKYFIPDSDDFKLSLSIEANI